MIVKNKNCTPSNVTPTTVQNDFITTELVASVNTVDNSNSDSTEVQATEAAESKASECSEVEESPQEQKSPEYLATKYHCTYESAEQFQNAYSNFENYCDICNNSGCVCMYQETWNMDDGALYGIIYEISPYIKNNRHYLVVKVMVGNEKVLCIRAKPDFACADPIFKAARRYFKTSFVDIDTFISQIIKIKIVNMINGDKSYSNISALRFVDDEELNVLLTLLNVNNKTKEEKA